MLDGLAGGPKRAVLPVRLRGALGVIAGCAAAVVAVVGMVYAGHRAPGRVDRWFVAPTADAVRPPWRWVAVGVDFLGDPAGAVALVALAVAGLVLLRDPRAAVFVVAATGATVATVVVVKPLVARTIHGEGNLSYPSGHTAFLTAFALVLALLLAGRLGLGRTAGTLLVLAASLAAGLSMGWAQVAISAHYPTDALGGWCTALVVVPGTGWLVDRTARGAEVTRCAGTPV
ncbi:phosphatase PAP2 family protein [Streptomyces sp. KLOTTS4A1]|uniref:phosphatase PAP2 family protein n=1 Tax=Streptomyces sp. KLOTTS4A1 TaxID=3390996 RepID=UPI0039F54909